MPYTPTNWADGNTVTPALLNHIEAGIDDVEERVTTLEGEGGATDEEIQDVVGAMVTGNTETNITVTYNDTTGKLDFNATGGGATDLDSLTDVTLTSPADSDILQRKVGVWVNRTMSQLKADLNLNNEDIQDLIGAMISGNNETGIAVTYDDVNGKLDFVVSGGGGGATDLEGLTDVDLTTPVDDDIIQRKAGLFVNRTLAQLKTDLVLTDENIQDLIGAMVTGNTESGGTLTYDDTNGKLDLTVSGGGGGATDLEGLTDVDLTTPADDDFLQRKSGQFVNRSISQVKTDLAVTDENIQDLVGAMVTGNTETNITVTYNDTTGKLDFVASSGGGSGIGDAIITVAASDTDTLFGQKTNADYICTGTADSVTIQTALDALPAEGGEVVLLPGKFVWSSTVKMTKQNCSLRFTSGAWGEWSSVTGRTPLIQMLAWYCAVHNARLQGSGSKGNGVGIMIGGQASTEPIVGGSQVHGCHVVMWNGRLSAMDTGIEFGIQSDGTGSSGDNFVWGGRYSNVKTAIESAGFVNYVHSPYIANVNVGIRQTASRSSGKVVVKGAVINEWGSAGIELLNGRGSIFDDIWMEHVSPQSVVATECIRIAPTGGNRVRNPEFGFLHIHPIDVSDGTPEVYGFRISGNVEGLRARHLEFTDELPSSALIRQDSSHVGSENIIEKVSVGDTVPSGWNYSKLLSNASTSGTVVIREIPAPAGSAPGTTVGARTPTPSQGTYRLDVDGSPNSATYWAKRYDGHIAQMSSDTGTTSGLKDVIEALQADGVHFEAGAGRFHYLDSVTGAESWAGVEDHPSLTASGMTFSGAGIGSTFFSNRSNYTGGTDTEPFSFTNAQSITIRDLTIESAGFYKTTTDAIDLDQGSRCLIDHVCIRRSRSRGIVFDGGDAGKNATQNTVQNCLIQGCPEKPNLSVVAGGTLTASTTYRYAVSWTVMDLSAAGTAAETKESEVASIATDASNRSVRIYLKPGPYGTTERRIYRAPAGSSSWVRVTTVADNTTTQFVDTGGAGTSVTMPVSDRSTIYQAGIEFLGASGNKAIDNYIDGVGDDPVGTTGVGIHMIRKGSGTTYAPSSENQVSRNTVRASNSNGIKVNGGIDNQVLDNIIINPGTVASKVQAIRLDGTAAVTTTSKNLVARNRCIDNQDANSPSGGKTTSNTILINNVGTVSGNEVRDNILDAGASTPVVSDPGGSGSASIITGNTGFNPQGPSSITVGASPYTYTAGPSPEMVYIRGGTVSLIVKSGTTLFTATPASVRLEPNQSVVVTYSSAPTMIKDQL